MNTQINYTLRDATDYKAFGQVYLRGLPSEGIQSFEEKLRKALNDGEYFNAEQLGIPELPSYTNCYSVNEDDHCWHEFTGCCQSNHAPTDQRSPKEFLQAARECQKVPWATSHPADHPEARIPRRDKLDNGESQFHI